MISDIIVVKRNFILFTEVIIMKYYLAVDIGASSGRHILGHLGNGKIKLEEIYRFENGIKKVDGHLIW